MRGAASSGGGTSQTALARPPHDRAFIVFCYEEREGGRAGVRREITTVIASVTSVVSNIVRDGDFT